MEKLFLSILCSSSVTENKNLEKTDMLMVDNGGSSLPGVFHFIYLAAVGKLVVTRWTGLQSSNSDKETPQMIVGRLIIKTALAVLACHTINLPCLYQ